ncbi:nuclease (SNase domain-containing protein) [Crinalium epipsammum PCC 9333]|uniref:Nuclease (SNase domain-containing protein) n=1 Tax=Crinalium epipsammum PCC 9333 TaxID=1173022 RepID=K9VXZ8_9CYAN|nr:thermonuclease family protein [Crinalium epipsammum]AFZ12841.1 nuclease (SNase domain-containing protein) [Crinalium epipsammum PCC 9333]
MTGKKKINQQPLIWVGAFILLLSLLGCENLFKPSTTKSPTYSVKRVSDGDTLAVTDSSGNNFNVRFACMDAPEIAHSNAEKQSKKAVDKNQFKWGVQAQQRLQKLVEQGSDRVALTVTDTDRYGRKVSEVRLPNGTLVQEVLIRDGLAMVYTPYLKNCPSAAVVKQAEAEAKQARRGIWGDSKFVPAWEFRKEQRQAKAKQ